MYTSYTQMVSTLSAILLPPSLAAKIDSAQGMYHRLPLLTLLLCLTALLGAVTSVQAQFSDYDQDQRIDDRRDIPEDLFYIDLDADGDLDILQGCTAGIYWFENLGGSFGSRILLYDDGSGLNTLGLADLNGDGVTELVATTSNGFTVLEGNVSMGYTVVADQFLPIGLASLNALLAGDMNGDGMDDMVFNTYINWSGPTTNEGRIRCVVNGGSEGFSWPQDDITTEEEDPRQIDLTDIDGDGDLDIVAYLYESSRLVYYANDGSAVFAAAETILDLATEEPDFLLADINADGISDILLHQNDEVQYLLASGGGQFEAATALFDLPSGRLHSLSDHDMDGDSDFLIYDEGVLSWMENTAPLSYSAAVTLLTLSEKARFDAEVDLDGDGDMDYISDRNSLEADWTITDGITQSEMVFWAMYPGAEEIAFADMNGDGFGDLVCGYVRGDNNNPLNIGLTYHSGDGTGEFGPAQIILDEDFDGLDILDRYELVDLTGDGHLDALFSQRWESDPLANGVYFVPNNGDGTFGFPVQVTPESAHDVHAFDADGDGDIDIVKSSPLSYLENAGDGTFSPAVTFGPEGDAVMTSGDVNGDGIPDLLAIHDTDVMVYQNSGGSFSLGEVVDENVAEVDRYADIAMADLDGDGDLDLMHVQASGAFLIYQNVEGQYADALQVVSSAFRSVAAADIDLDGDMDILLRASGNASTSWQRAVWLESVGLFDYVVHPIEHGGSDVLGNNLWSLMLADVDADGDPDVVGSNWEKGMAYFSNSTGDGCTDPEACNFDAEAFQNDGSCCYGDCGCTDPIAENYLESATCDDGSCQYILGCTDETATNYDSLATMTNDSCLYTIIGQVFFDENENGLYDDSENGLSGQLLSVESLGLSTISAADGSFIFNDVTMTGNYLLTHTNEPAFPFYTIQESYVALVGGESQTEYLFGLSNEEPLGGLEVTSQGIAGGYLCDDQVTHWVSFENTGNQVVDVIVQITVDSLFQFAYPSDEVDSISGTHVFMSTQGLAPSQTNNFNFDLQTPTVEFIGEYLDLRFQAWGVSGSDTLAYVIEEYSRELTCAYDPNDKQVFPEGYGEDHYVQESTALDYLIRFQNTGNAPAQNVRIIDSIADGLDLSTFQLDAHSHDVYVLIDEDERLLDFYFEDIQLPDSVNNEPDSHGFIAFSIRPEADLPLLSRLENTAEIYFDNNPPIITNTTWSTTYDCSLFEASFNDVDAPVLIASEGDTYQWYVDGEPIEGATDQELLAEINGADYTVEIQSGFPCTESATIFVVWTSLNEFDGREISLFPNPMTSHAMLLVDKLPSDAQLQLTDLQGRSIRSIDATAQGPIIIERAGVPAGVYLLTISAEGKQKTMRLVME